MCDGVGRKRKERRWVRRKAIPPKKAKQSQEPAGKALTGKEGKEKTDGVLPRGGGDLRGGAGE